MGSRFGKSIKLLQTHNGGMQSVTNIHWDTPLPDRETTYVPRIFGIEPPSKPKPQEISCTDRMISVRCEAIENANYDAYQSYLVKLDEWNRKKAEFERQEEERRISIESKRFNGIDSMQKFLSDALVSIEWPHETSVNFEIEEDGAAIYLDVGPPEISASQTHAIGFRLIGEVFAALHSIRTVVLSGYPQRADKKAGRADDVYPYSMKVTRDEWSKINFNDLKALDVVECLGRFEIKM